MLANPRTGLRQWFLNRIPTDRGQALLDHRRIYILPTRQGLWFAGVLFLMLLGSVNYGASLGYMLTFLLVGMGLVGTLYTFRNLQHLEIRFGTPRPVFAGDTAELPLMLVSHSGRNYYDLDFGHRRDRSLNVPAGSLTRFSFPFDAARRGLQRVQPIRISTEYPLGLFHAWSWLRPDSQVLVYPRPLADSAPMPLPVGGDHPQLDGRLGQDDLVGIRAYRKGDPLKRVTWKSLAKGLPLQTLEYQGDADSELYFDWRDVTGRDVEARLSQLCRWILDAEQSSLVYGLRLPGVEVPLGQGRAHRDNCLQHLALFSP